MATEPDFNSLNSNQALAHISPEGNWGFDGEIKVGDRTAVVACHWFYRHQSADQRRAIAMLTESARDAAVDGFSWIEGHHTGYLPELIGRAFKADSAEYLRQTHGRHALFHKVSWQRALGATMCELFHRGHLDPDVYFLGKNNDEDGADHA